MPVAACLFAVALFSGMDVLMKQMSLVAGAYNAIIWRGVVASALGLPMLLLAGARRPPAAVMRLHLRRGVIIAAMAWLFFWALTRMPLAEGIALSFIAPIIALYLAALLLGEKISTGAIAAGCAGLAGVGVILSGQLRGHYDTDMLLGALAALASAVLFAYNLVLQREQAQVASPAEITFYQNIIVTVTLLPAAPWLFIAPGADMGVSVTLAAMLAMGSQWLLSWAYARAEAQRLIPLEYSAFLWAALFGWLVFDEPLTAATLVGAALIVGGCLLAARDQPESAGRVESDTV